MRRILVTSALPYANGSIHLGHLLEGIQADVWTRFQKLVGNQVYHVCADDAHGTATMLTAKSQGLSPEEHIRRSRDEHERDLRAFHIAYDNYYTTHSRENEELSSLIFERLRRANHIFTKKVDQLYDTEAGMFLADRNLRGTCPRCGNTDQPGDNCDICGATYAATELGEPRSVLSGSTPQLRTSEHYFFNLPAFEDFLRTWIRSGAVQAEVANKLEEWLDAGLQPWDISRDAPYFGFRIPGTEDKYFYVWLDAPIGYIASFKHYCDRTGKDWESFWKSGSDAEIHHFIGKDIINFHALFWPALLDGSGFSTPTRIHTHGYITADGVKMSKSRGTFVNAVTYLKHLDPDCLRYYFSARLTPTTDDIDLRFDFSDFVQRVNTDLVGKHVNIASRCAGFVTRDCGSRLSSELDDPGLWARFIGARDEIREIYELGNTNRALRQVMDLADECNRYIANREPWTMIKDPAKQEEAQRVCTTAINLFRVLAIYLKPVVPGLTERTERFLNDGELSWSDLSEPLLNHEIAPFKRLMSRIEDKAVQRLIKDCQPSRPPVDVAARPSPEPEHIDLATFQKADLRVAEVLSAELVDGADKLLKLRLNVGDHERTVFSGIRDAYDPDTLVGRHAVVVANLAPRKMRFGVSEGMLLAAGPGGKEIFLISPDAGVKPGMRVS